MKEEFVAACNNTTNGFNAIIQALQLPRGINPSEVTRLLSFIDNIIEYYLQLDKQETIRYPIIYIPCAKEWAEDVCIEYVAYKIESAFDANRLRQIKADLQKEIDTTGRRLNESEQRRFFKEEVEWRRKIRPIARAINNTSKNVRNLIVCGKSAWNRIEAKLDLTRFFGENPKTSITCSNVITVRKQQADFKDFENIFCFYSRNKICEKYEINSLFNWTRLKNCFVFEFSSAPYCLHNVLESGKRLCELFPGKPLLSQNNENIYPDFITLTSEEARYLINEKPQNAHIVIPLPTIIEEDRDYISDLYKFKADVEWGFSIKDRDLLSLCLCQDAKNVYIEYLKNKKPLIFEDSYWLPILELILQSLPNQKIIDKIISFIDLYTEAAFVICDAPDSIKTIVKKLFADKGIKINFYRYYDLKNKIVKEKKIVILCFRPQKYYNKYKQSYSFNNPNSFDDYSLDEGQSAIDIINEIAIIDYGKYRFDYELEQYETTNSQFRRVLFGDAWYKPQTPGVQCVSFFSEQDDDASERPQGNPIQTVTFVFSDESTVQLPETEDLIYVNKNGERFIKSIRSLNENDQLNQIKAIQPISELADKTIDVFFDDRRRLTTTFENTLRDSYVKQGIIPADHDRSVPIWKFLLDRKIREYCVENGLINNNQQEPLWQLLRNDLDNECLQNLQGQIGVRVLLKTVLQNWCDTSTIEPLAPGINRDREKLIIGYLGLNRGVLSLYRKKQLLKRNMTRTRNKTTEDFLSRILFAEITKGLSEELLNDSRYTEYLPIESKEDIETLKAIALEHINLIQVKSYTI